MSAVIFWIRSSELISSPSMLANTALVAASARALAVRLSDPLSILMAAALRPVAPILARQVGDRQLKPPIVGAPVL